MADHLLVYTQGMDVINWVSSGNAIITVKNTESGNRFTYKFRKADPNPDFPQNTTVFVSVLSNHNNESDYTFLGTIFMNGYGVRYAHSRKSRFNADTQSAKVIAWLIDKAMKNAIPDGIAFYHSGRCLRCNRLLTVPESILTGYGEECFSKL